LLNLLTVLICVYRGRIMYTDMYNMLRNMEPPVGFGKKCPYRLAYRVRLKVIDVNLFIQGGPKIEPLRIKLQLHAQ